MKIKSPAPHYTAKDTYGPTVLEFKDGVAEVDDLPAGVRQYLIGAGYGIDADPETPEATAPADPRDQSLVRVGTELRDAAVDPKPEDFLAPANAGEPGERGNPHGPHVVSPELHASQGVRPVLDGPVEEAEQQEPAETGHAEQDTFDAAPPAGNASKADWEAYALTQGRTPEELDGLTRDQLRDLFTKE